MHYEIVERIAVSFWPSLAVAGLGLVSYYVVDKLRETLKEGNLCQYSGKEHSGLYKRWYFKKVPLAAVSALSTVAIGAMVTFLSTLDGVLLPAAYTTFLLCFLAYWGLNVSFIAVTVMNANCTWQLRFCSVVVQSLPILALVFEAAYLAFKQSPVFA
jgi:hypothetical protein